MQSGYAKSTKIRAAWKYLSRKAFAKLTISLVISHLDYANLTLAGLPKVSLDKLQRVQNMAAKRSKIKVNRAVQLDAQKSYIGSQ